MTRLVGLTGSIGMGKSTTARMFADEGVPVWDADAAVARLYAPRGAAVGPVSAEFPGAVQDGGISRDRLKVLLAADPSALRRLEEVVHPLVAADRRAFIDAHPDADLLLFDIPLLFETGAEAWLDHVIVVTVPADVQRTRVLSRPGMTEAQFDLILSRQLPDAEKRARADTIIETLTLDGARAAVAALVDRLRKEQPRA